jgi:hypothetical protein
MKRSAMVAVTILIAVLGVSGSVTAQTPFYQGKTVRIVVGYVR